jgi:predicted DCC family thiol-disulfide oxidoreductase YuxK
MTTQTAAQAAVESLPAPAERPQAEVVIYDGECRFCRAQVARLHRWDTHQRLSFISLHDPEVTRRWPDLDHDSLMKEMYVIDPQGRRYAGGDAIRHLSTQIPHFYWFSPILHFPGSGPVWRFLYRHFAKRRYLFGRVHSCDNGACRL